MGEGRLEEEAFVIHWGWVQSFNSSLILILAKEKLVNSLAGFIMDHSFIFNFFLSLNHAWGSEFCKRSLFMVCMLIIYKSGPARWVMSVSSCSLNREAPGGLQPVPRHRCPACLGVWVSSFWEKSRPWPRRFLLAIWEWPRHGASAVRRETSTKPWFLKSLIVQNGFSGL